MWLGGGLAIYFPYGKYMYVSLPNSHPFTPNVAQFARRMPELRHRLFFAEINDINLRKNCGE